MATYIFREKFGGSVLCDNQLDAFQEDTYTIPDSPEALDGLIRERPANWGLGRAALLGEHSIDLSE